MFDLSWAEIAVLVVVALIFIGPKDLPVAMRTLSKAMRGMRSLASEFQRHLDEMVQQADLSETRDQLRDLQKFNLRDQVSRIVDPDRQLRDSLELKGEGVEGLPRVPAPPPPPSLSHFPTHNVQDVPPVVTRNLDRPPEARSGDGVSDSEGDSAGDSRAPEAFLTGRSAGWANEFGEGGSFEEKPERTKEEEILSLAPSILPPRTALRLIKEAPYWQRPAILPPEISLHNGRRVVIVTETLSENAAETRPEVPAGLMAETSFSEEAVSGMTFRETLPRETRLQETTLREPLLRETAVTKNG